MTATTHQHETVNAIGDKVHAYLLAIPHRDGISPHCQIAMGLLHDASLNGGGLLNVASLLSPSILRSLVKRGIIDGQADLTERGCDLIAKWRLGNNRARAGQRRFADEP